MWDSNQFVSNKSIEHIINPWIKMEMNIITNNIHTGLSYLLHYVLCVWNCSSEKLYSLTQWL